MINVTQKGTEYIVRYGKLGQKKKCIETWSLVEQFLKEMNIPKEEKEKKI